MLLVGLQEVCEIKTLVGKSSEQVHKKKKYQSTRGRDTYYSTVQRRKRARRQLHKNFNININTRWKYATR